MLNRSKLWLRLKVWNRKVLFQVKVKGRRLAESCFSCRLEEGPFLEAGFGNRSAGVEWLNQSCCTASEDLNTKKLISQHKQKTQEISSLILCSCTAKQVWPHGWQEQCGDEWTMNMVLNTAAKEWWGAGVDHPGGHTYTEERAWDKTKDKTGKLRDNNWVTTWAVTLNKLYIAYY